MSDGEALSFGPGEGIRLGIIEDGVSDGEALSFGPGEVIRLGIIDG